MYLIFYRNVYNFTATFFANFMTRFIIILCVQVTDTFIFVLQQNLVCSIGANSLLIVFRQSWVVWKNNCLKHLLNETT